VISWGILSHKVSEIFHILKPYLTFYNSSIVFCLLHGQDCIRHCIGLLALNMSNILQGDGPGTVNAYLTFQKMFGYIWDNKTHDISVLTIFDTNFENGCLYSMKEYKHYLFTSREN
jgi:hypothetical protein